MQSNTTNREGIESEEYFGPFKKFAFLMSTKISTLYSEAKSRGRTTIAGPFASMSDAGPLSTAQPEAPFLLPPDHVCQSRGRVTWLQS